MLTWSEWSIILIMSTCTSGDQSFWSCQTWSTGSSIILICQLVLQVFNHSDHVNMFYRFINHSDHVNKVYRFINHSDHVNMYFRWSIILIMSSCSTGSSFMDDHVEHLLTGDQNHWWSCRTCTWQVIRIILITCQHVLQVHQSFWYVNMFYRCSESFWSPVRTCSTGSSIIDDHVVQVDMIRMIDHLKYMSDHDQTCTDQVKYMLTWSESLMSHVEHQLTWSESLMIMKYMYWHVIRIILITCRTCWHDQNDGSPVDHVWSWSDMIDHLRFMLTWSEWSDHLKYMFYMVHQSFWSPVSTCSDRWSSIILIMIICRTWSDDQNHWWSCRTCTSGDQSFWSCQHVTSGDQSFWSCRTFSSGDQNHSDHVNMFYRWSIILIMSTCTSEWSIILIMSTCSTGSSIILIMSTCSSGDPSFWSCQHVPQVVHHSDHDQHVLQVHQSFWSWSDMFYRLINHSDHVNMFYRLINHSDHVNMFFRRSIILIMSTCSTGDPSFWSCQHVLQAIQHSDHVNMFHRWSIILIMSTCSTGWSIILIMSTCSTGSSIILIMSTCSTGSSIILIMSTCSTGSSMILICQHVLQVHQSFWYVNMFYRFINHSDHVNKFYRFINHSDHVNMSYRSSIILIMSTCPSGDQSFWSCQHAPQVIKYMSDHDQNDWSPEVHVDHDHSDSWL